MVFICSCFYSKKFNLNRYDLNEPAISSTLHIVEVTQMRATYPMDKTICRYIAKSSLFLHLKTGFKILESRHSLLFLINPIVITSKFKPLAIRNSKTIELQLR